MQSFADYIRQFLTEHGVRLNTDLGQHFLIDEEILAMIVESADIEPNDHVVEIGPGMGILTRELLERTPHVTSIELDARLIPLLRQYIEMETRTDFTLIQGNALQVPLPDTAYKIVANIPYHITSPLLRHAFLESKRPPTSMTLLIQKEVAQKIADTKSRSLLSVIVQLFGTPHLMFSVPARAFLPPPDVESAVLFIDCFEKPLATPETVERILKLTKIAFGQKRKMLRNSIGQIPGGAEAMETLGIAGDRRPEMLSIEEWIGLAENIHDDRHD